MTARENLRCKLIQVAKRAERPTARVFRPARTLVPGVVAKLGDLQCTVANLSSSGAMLHSRLKASVGRDVNLVLELPTPVIAKVRVVRCDPIDVALPGEAVWRRQDFSLGVHFLEHHDELAAAIRTLAKQAGIEHAHARVLILGKDDEVSRLADKVLADAEYEPRVLTQLRYAVSIAKRIAARAIVVNVDIEPQFSPRSVIDTLRADTVTGAMPIVLCARQASARQGDYSADRGVRLLRVPFTPEELVAAVDGAIDELS